MSEKQRKRIIEYFRNPDISNAPAAYLDEAAFRRSTYLVNIIDNLFPDKTIHILELGSGTGRNIHFLQKGGYPNVYGIEQSPAYLKLMRERFPELKDRVLEGLLEIILPILKKRYDLVFTMAVLEHIPNGPVFDEISKIARHVLTIEDERCNDWRHFPRNYKDFFETRGLAHVQSWRFPPLGFNFVMRLFKGRP